MENAIVIAIVTAAGAYLAFRAGRSLRSVFGHKYDADACGDCSCPANPAETRKKDGAVS